MMLKLIICLYVLEGSGDWCSGFCTKLLNFYLQMNEAAMIALEENLTSTDSTSNAAPWTIKTTHFEQALSKISPSVSDKV